jgi:hypothetical protein
MKKHQFSLSPDAQEGQKDTHTIDELLRVLCLRGDY